MTQPEDAVQVDAGAMIAHYERILTGAIRDLALTRTMLDTANTDNAELRRQLRVKEALSNDASDASDASD